MENIDLLSANAIRVLSIEAIQKAKSGHPGICLGCAPVLYELYARHFMHNPEDTTWTNRDRFILSAGHGSAMLYSTMHLFGYEDVTMEEMKNFRQLGSKTPGHPEYAHTKGVDASTGPLGAGLAMAVGMAMAEKHMAAKFNRPGFPIVDHYTYTLCGDGCLMEGISSEAFSLAGTLGLSKLIVLYDANNITIEGDISATFNEDVCKRMEAFGFQCIKVADGNDMDAVGKAIEAAKADTEHPSFIMCSTTIGYGCEAKQGCESSHGAPLGEDNVAATKKVLGWPETESFKVPDEVYAHCESLKQASKKTYDEWNALFKAYGEKYPELKEEWDLCHDREKIVEKVENSDYFKILGNEEATRMSSYHALQELKEIVPNFFGGSADLGSSSMTIMQDVPFFSKEVPEGSNIHFGVREIAMAGIANGILLYGGLTSYLSTFFVFSDYIKPMARLASIMRIPQIYIFSHDSIGVGEDGATHEPIEQLAMFRSMPNCNVFRPADESETRCAWYSALASKETPTALILSRQKLPKISDFSKDSLRGAYILKDSTKQTPDVILMGSGSEVSLLVEAKEILAQENIDARVVSMPCMEIFEAQDEAYREKVLPKNVRARVAVEAGTGFAWYRYVGLDGAMICINNFGLSAPAAELFKKYGFTVENVVATAKKVLA